MNKRVGKQKAKETLPKLLDMVSKGLGPVEIYDQRSDKTLAYLVAPDKLQNHSKRKSYAGFLKGKLWVSPDFDEPDWELIKHIENSK